ncbi:MAG TPA: hypothetical protein PKZ42_01820 [Syntrophales bacterium]|nr:hypothetical protein [Syntrophales bacterium]
MKKYITLFLLSTLLLIGSARAEIQRATLFNPDTCERKVVEIGQPGIFDGGWELETPNNNCGSDLLQVGVATGDSDLPLTLASFETTLASKLITSATEMTLTSATDDDGNTLSGYYGFTIDSGSTLQEYVIANCTGTTCTGMLRGISVADGQTEVTALKQEHRRGASVKVTNHPNLVIITEILNGNDGVPAKLYYDSQPTFSDDEEIITKKYADDLAFSGAPNASETVKGIIEIGTQTEVASSTATGGTGADLVIPADIATSSPDVRGLYIPVSENDGYLDQDWLDLTEDFSLSGNNNFSGTNLFTASTTLTATTSISASDINNDAFILNGVSYQFPASNGASSTALMTDGSGSLSWNLSIITPVMLQTTRDFATSSEVINLSHGLGRVPSYVKIYGRMTAPSTINQVSTGFSDGTNNYCIYSDAGSGSDTRASGQSSSVSVHFEEYNTVGPTRERQEAVVTFDETNIIFTWTETVVGTGYEGTIYLSIEVY